MGRKKGQKGKMKEEKIKKISPMVIISALCAKIICAPPSLISEHTPERIPFFSTLF